MKSAVRIALIYALLAGLYIVLSDYMTLHGTQSDPDVLTRRQSMKGLAFVGVSAAGLFFMVLHYARRRDHAQRVLEEARQSFEALFRRNPLPALVYDIESLRFLAVNDAAVDEYGWDQDAFLGLTIAEIHPASDVGKLLKHIERAGTHPYVGQSQHVRRDGTTFEVEVTAHHMIFSGRRARLAMVADISARKLTERALAEAFAAKEDASEAKSRFLSTISHEMRTPLNSITGCLDLLLHQPQPDEANRRDFAALALRSADDLLTLIKRLIDAAALSSGPVRRETREIETEPFLRHIVDEFSQAAARNHLKLNLVCTASLPGTASFDAGRIEETLHILIGNAIKFSHAGVIEVLGRMRREDGSALLELVVSDEGIGIPAAQQSRVFDSFFQVDQNLARKFGGVGMGLFVAKQLCDLAGARLSLTSEAGAGSKFVVAVPGHLNDAGRFVADSAEATGVNVVG